MCCLAQSFSHKSVCPSTATQCAGQSKHARVAASRSAAPAGLQRPCQLVLIRDVTPARHGLPRFCGTSASPGAGNRPSPASTAMVRNLPTLQEGHKLRSILATRAMKAWAHSSACKFGAGICKAARAAGRLTPLHPPPNRAGRAGISAPVNETLLCRLMTPAPAFLKRSACWCFNPRVGC